MTDKLNNLAQLRDRFGSENPAVKMAEVLAECHSGDVPEHMMDGLRRAAVTCEHPVNPHTGNPWPLGEVQHTPRGFEVISFLDYYGKHCELQQSSLARHEPPGSSAVWLGPEEDRMHLDRARVAMLISHLRAWLETGSLGINGPRK